VLLYKERQYNNNEGRGILLTANIYTMKKKTLLFAILLLFVAVPVAAQVASDDHTASEEALGKVLWQKLQAKETECSKLSDDEFGYLGEYFMGQMLGDAHASMNEMIKQTHGEEGEEGMHVVMGKRLSGCDTNAVLSAGSQGFMPMMTMMGGGMWSDPSFDTNNWKNSMLNGGSMMSYGFWGPWTAVWFIWHLFWWAFVIAALIWFVKWLVRGGGKHRGGSSALDVLKERYAKGEVSKQEFDEKKKDILA